MNVHEKLMKARLMLQKKELKKSGHNKFAGYHYFELGDFLPAIQEIFSEVGLCGIVSYSADTATLTIHDTQGEGTIQITSPMASAALKGCHEVQNVGAVETYQRRYLWVTAMEIVEHDVLDATTGKKDGISATTGAWEAMSTDEQTFLTDLADEVKEMLSKGNLEGAKKHIESANLGTEEKIALWTRFDSKERAAMKKKPELKEAA